MAVIAYLLLLPGEKDAEDQKAAIDAFVKEKGLHVESYITTEVPAGKNERRRRIGELFANISNWDVVAISDLSRTASSVIEVVNIVGSLSGRGIRLLAARQGMDLGGPADAQSKAMSYVLDMFSGLEKEFASGRIRDALAERKRAGVVLGRPRGSISASKLDDKKDLIVEYLSKGVSKASLARILDTSPSNLLSYLKTRKIEAAGKARKRAQAATVLKVDAPPKGNIEKDDPKDRNTAKPAGAAHIPVNHIEEVREVVLCRHCGKNILDPRTTSCAGGYIDYRDNESHHRIPYPEDEKERCPKCGVEPGGYHHDGCYMERCPRCGERLVSCACNKV